MVNTRKQTELDKVKAQVACPVELSLRILGGKWRGSVLYQLRNGPLRFNELKYRVQDAVVDYDGADNYLSNKVLAGHLHSLTEFGLVEKTELDNQPGYYLTERGKSVVPILLDLFYWGDKNF